MMARVPRAERGQATVELALCIPMAILVLAALYEACTVASDQVRLWHAAREAARAAVVESHPRAARRAAEKSGLVPLEVAVTPEPAHRGVGAPLSVTLMHRHRGRAPLVGKLFEHLVLEATATMRIEQP